MGRTLRNICITVLLVYMIYNSINFHITTDTNYKYDSTNQKTVNKIESNKHTISTPSLPDDMKNNENRGDSQWDVTNDDISNSDSGMIQSNDETLAGVRVLWTSPETFIRGILFVAHGCNHAATDWFEDCQDCIGLAEELSIVKMAVEEFNFAVVAISSVQNCWSVTVDGPRVASALKLFQNKYVDKNSPIYAFGASSGGAFVSQLGPFLEENQFNYPHVRLQAFISQIMASAPPTPNVHCAVYITMNRDTHTDRAAKQIVSKKYVSHYSLPYDPESKEGELKVKHIQLPPLQINKSFFHERIPKVSKHQSQKIYESLKQNEWLNSDGYLTKDPRQFSSEWKEILRPYVPVKQDSLIADQSSISEVINVAYSMHELTRDGVQEALTFCKVASHLE